MIAEPDNNQISPVPRKSKAQALTEMDARAIAKLVSTRKLTEVEACLTLEINPVQWRNWKSRNKNNTKFEELITKIKADKINHLMNGIDDVSNGIGVKQRDWRAGAYLLEKIAYDRFGEPKNQPAQVNANLNVMVMGDTLKRIYSVETEKPVQQLAAPAFVPRRK